MEQRPSWNCRCKLAALSDSQTQCNLEIQDTAKYYTTLHQCWLDSKTTTMQYYLCKFADLVLYPIILSGHVEATLSQCKERSIRASVGMGGKRALRRGTGLANANLIKQFNVSLHKTPILFLPQIPLVIFFRFAPVTGCQVQCREVQPRVHLRGYMKLDPVRRLILWSIKRGTFSTTVRVQKENQSGEGYKGKTRFVP